MKILENSWLKEGFRRYTENTGYLFFEKIIRILVAVFVWALTARFLGADKFGIFNFALSFVYLLGIVSDLGLDQVVIRELVKGAYKTNQVLGTVFVMKFIGSISSMLLIVVITGLLSMDAYTKLIICILSLRLVFQSFNVIEFYFKSQVLSKYVVYSQITALMITAILCLFFIYLKLPLIYFVCVVVIEAAITSALNISYVMKYQKISDWQFDSEIAGKLLSDAWPMIVSGIAIAIYMRIDQIMIKEMLGAASVGYYAAATRLSEAFYFVPLVITSSLFPAIINAKLRDNLQYESRLRALFAILFWPAFIMSLLTAAIATPLINVLYGQEFMPAAKVLPIHIWASIFVFLGVARQAWVVSENLQIYTMAYVVIAAAINILLNLILIPKLGIRGAAVATVISQFVSTVLSNLFSKKTRSMFYLQLSSIHLNRTLRELHITR